MKRLNSQRGMTLIEVLLAVLLASVLIAIPLAVIQGGGAGLSRQSSAIRAISDIDQLTSQLRNSAHTSVGIYTPASCGGAGAGDGTPCAQVRFYGQDSTGGKHYWGWSFAGGSLVQCLSYAAPEDARCAVTGSSIRMSTFQATPTPPGQLSVASQLDPNATVDFPATEYAVLGTNTDPAQRAVAGNRVMVIRLGNAYVEREIHLLQGGAPFSTSVLMGAYLSPTIGPLALVPSALTFRVGGAQQNTTATEPNYGTYQKYLTTPPWTVSACQSAAGKRVASLRALGSGVGDSQSYAVTPLTAGTCLFTVTTYDQSVQGSVTVGSGSPVPTPTPSASPTASPDPNGPFKPGRPKVMSATTSEIDINTPVEGPSGGTRPYYVTYVVTGSVPSEGIGQSCGPVSPPLGTDCPIPGGTGFFAPFYPGTTYTVTATYSDSAGHSAGVTVQAPIASSPSPTPSPGGGQVSCNQTMTTVPFSALAYDNQAYEKLNGTTVSVAAPASQMYLNGEQLPFSNQDQWVVYWAGELTLGSNTRYGYPLLTQSGQSPQTAILGALPAWTSNLGQSINPTTYTFMELPLGTLQAGTQVSMHGAFADAKPTADVVGSQVNIQGVPAPIGLGLYNISAGTITENAESTSGYDAGQAYPGFPSQTSVPQQFCSGINACYNTTVMNGWKTLQTAYTVTATGQYNAVWIIGGDDSVSQQASSIVGQSALGDASVACDP
jgi:prepilin-type N-terminal cleavage/methylation domain-containing protein